MLSPLFETEAMAAIFSERARLQGMLDFEAALARAEAAAGLIPAAAAEAIARVCVADNFDLADLAQATAQAGNPAIPMVKQLTALVGKADASAARFVHWGATSQDATDTGLVLQMRAGLASLEEDLRRLSDALATLANLHARTPMIGRTLMQQAVPVTLGLKVAGWLSAVERNRKRIAAAGAAARVLQFGGAAGTLASLGDRGLDVAKELAKAVDLDLPELPWHTQRDRFVDVAAALGLLVGTLGKIARDISLLMQTEVGEAFEPTGHGRGGSSTMPHKRNPIGGAVVLAAAIRAPQLVATLLAAMPQEHERGLGGWHAEWETMPEIFRLAAGALRHTADIAAGLTVDPKRMGENLEATGGLVMAEAVMMALGDSIGRLEAHRLIEAACGRAVAEGRHLRDVLAQDAAVTAHLSPAALDRLFAPDSYLGVAERFVQRVLAGRTSG
ncbi:MAG: 3-carboxy-cis,cis-muconate cycloisomerase [Dongiaceae bacterium]